MDREKSKVSIEEGSKFRDNHIIDFTDPECLDKLPIGEVEEGDFDMEMGKIVGGSSVEMGYDYPAFMDEEEIDVPLDIKESVDKQISQFKYKYRTFSIKKGVEDILATLRYNEINTFEKLDKCISLGYISPYMQERQIDVDLCNSIINELRGIFNARVETIQDLKRALLDIKSYKKDFDLKEMGEVLFYVNSKLYSYKEDGNDKKVVFTDTDIIPVGLLTEVEEKLIYGIMHTQVYRYEPYDVIVNYYNKVNSPVLRKAKLQQWYRTINEIITNIDNLLEKYKGEDVGVTIPFIPYVGSLKSLKKIFLLSVDIISGLMENTLEKFKLENNVLFTEIPTVYELLDEFKQDLNEEMSEAVRQEMIRRGYGKPNEKREEGNAYKRLFIGNNTLVKQVVKERVEDNKEKNESTLKRAGVMYYMLKDKIDIALMHKVIYFAINPQKEYIKGANDTIYTYLTHPKERFLSKIDTIDFIKETLRKYKFKEEEISKIDIANV